MNIYQTVIDTVTATAGDITESAGFININGTSKLFIPKLGVVAGRRLVIGEKPQVWTVTIPSTPSNSTTYTVSVTGKSTVTGVSKTFTASYTTAVSGTTQAQLSAGLAVGLTTNESPFTVTDGASTLTITAKSGTPTISTASNLLAVANSTVGYPTNVSTTAVATSGTVTAVGTFAGASDLGKAVTITDTATPFNSYTGFISAATSSNTATVTPTPTTAIATGKLLVVDNTGLTLESVYAYAALPGVALNPTNRYIVYEIDAATNSDSGNGARPDAIESKYIIYVNGGGANNPFGASNFDGVLAAKCGLSNF